MLVRPGLSRIWLINSTIAVNSDAVMMKRCQGYEFIIIGSESPGVLPLGYNTQERSHDGSVSRSVVLTVHVCIWNLDGSGLQSSDRTICQTMASRG